MRRRRVFRDQNWLNSKRFDEKIVHTGIIQAELVENNKWIKPGRAMADLYEAYEKLKNDSSFNEVDCKAKIYRMSVWLRENRRIIPSSTTFRRFMSTISDT